MILCYIFVETLFLPIIFVIFLLQLTSFAENKTYYGNLALQTLSV